jgi:hypothetical protein
MDFRMRVMGLTTLLSALVGLFIGGQLFSPENRQARATSRPLLAIANPAEISGMELVVQGVVRLSLRRSGSAWEAVTGDRALPGSAARAEGLARLLAGLPRGALVSRAPARAVALGLGEDRARLLVIHRSGGQPDIGVLVGARAPSGEEDYVMLRGDPSAYLVRSNLSVLLSQDTSYWYDLAMFPPDVTGDTMERIDARGSLNLGREAGILTLGYVLVRRPGEQTAAGDQSVQSVWALQDDARAVDPLSASSMAAAIARLEGDDFGGAGAERISAQSAGQDAGQGAPLSVEVLTIDGKAYSLSARRAPVSDQLVVTTSWSPWTYLVNPMIFRRAVRPLVELLPR